jgi:hypothetical protein
MNERLSPTAAKKIINTMMRERGGTLRHRSYKERGVGKTEQWAVTTRLFDYHAHRLELKQHEPAQVTQEKAPAPAQQTLF